MARRKHDFYQTPTWVINRFLAVHPPPTRRVVEPAAGRGRIVKALHKRDYDVEAVELQRGFRDDLLLHTPKVTIGSWFDVVSEIKYPERKSIVGNPPFSLALEFCRSCLEAGFVYVAFLLRQGFLSSKKRAPFHNKWRRALSGIYPLDSRPSFDGKGTDMYDYHWLVWEPGSSNLNFEVLVR